MIVDEAKIHIKAGNGGNGGVFFNRNKMELGPTGGNGGRGGSVFFRGVSDLGALSPYARKREYLAESGENGRGQFVDGKDGADMILKVPVGTILFDEANDQKYEIMKINEEILIAKGGGGGKGNFKYRSPKNTTPKEFGPGIPGEEIELKLSLKFIADVGFVGLPNVGKSTLLNLLTNAKSKVANYEFTTLEPNLGVYQELVLADIPGLIEGASGGKGLGHKFLRHIERTTTIFHFLASDSKDILSDYHTIREELLGFNPKLIEKREVVIISKSDNVSNEELKEISTQAQTINKEVFCISMFDDASLVAVKKMLDRILRQKKATSKQNTK